MDEARWILQAILRLRTLFWRNRVEGELDEEFQFHIEQRMELEIARGVSPEEARRIALGRWTELHCIRRNAAICDA